MSAHPIADSDEVLRIEDLRLGVTGGRDLVHGISLAIRPGEIHGLVGESGSGKTLTGYSCLALLPEGVEKRSGSVLVDGRSVFDLEPAARRRLRGSTVSMISQDPLSGFHPMLTVGRQILHSLLDHGVDKATAKLRTIEVLGQARLPDPERVADRYPHELSGGMRQRAMIALALANRPKLLLADEPTTALDATVQAGVLRLLRSLRDDGLGVLFVTHNLGVVAGLCDSVSVMERGSLVEAGSVRGVLEEPQHPYTTALLAASPRLSAEPRPRLSTPAPEAAAEPIVTVAHAEQTYRGRGASGRAVHVHALRDVDLTVMPGETVSIVGESGSGKSTLSRLLVGLELPKSGTVRVADHDTSMLKGAAEKDFRRSVQMVFQDASRSLDPRYTVRQLLLEALRLRDPGAGRDEALELLDLVHLPRSAFGLRPGELSGGLRQRVAIARAVAPKPRLLVADEPVSALDVTNQQRIMSLFAELVAARDLTLVMVTHDLALVRDMSDRVVTMRQGSIVEVSTAAHFYAGPAHPYSRALLAAMPDPGLIGVLPAEAEREPTTTS